MNLPVAPGTDKPLLQTSTGASGEIRIARADGPLRAITPGSVVQVSVRRDPQQGSGVVLNGEFVRAAIPDSIPDGARLLVRVLPATDAIILKISSAAQLRGEQLISQSFEAILRSLLPDLKVSDLKKALPGDLPLGQDLAALLNGLEQKSSMSLESRGGAAIVKIFQSLLKAHALVGENVLKNPGDLQSALSLLSKGDGLRAVQQALETLSAQGNDKSTAITLRFLKAFEAHIESLLRAPAAAEGKPSAPEVKILAEQMKFYLVASQTAMESGNALALQRLSSDVQNLRRAADPVSFMLGLFRQLELPEEGGQAMQQQLSGTLKQLASDLQKIKESNPQPPMLKDLLRAIQQKSGGIREQLEARGKDGELIPQAQQLLKGAESILQAQASLMQVNPVMQALGEPALVLIPALVQGIFGAWKVSVKEDPPDPEGQGKGSVKQFARISISMTLPHLGPLEIDIAHRKGEALVHIATTSAEATSLITERAGSLEKSFHNLGYEKTSLSSSTGKLKQGLPAWYRELARRTIVA